MLENVIITLIDVQKYLVDILLVDVIFLGYLLEFDFRVFKVGNNLIFILVCNGGACNVFFFFFKNQFDYVIIQYGLNIF